MVQVVPEEVYTVFFWIFLDEAFRFFQKMALSATFPPLVLVRGIVFA